VWRGRRDATRGKEGDLPGAVSYALTKKDAAKAVEGRRGAGGMK